jgi:hypothetical protein
MLLIPVAIVSTISYLFRSRGLSMAQIQLRLATLEELLRGTMRKEQQVGCANAQGASQAHADKQQ